MHPMAVLFSSVYFGKPALTSQTTVHLSPAPFVLLAGHSYFNVTIMTGSDRTLSIKLSWGIQFGAFILQRNVKMQQ